MTDGVKTESTPPPTLHLYLDDSGTRRPDRVGGAEPGTWFALGGYLLADHDRDDVRARYDSLRAKWDPHIGSAPLHSNDMRNGTNGFTWLRGNPELATEFFADLDALLVNSPILCTACVVSRPGYTARYAEQYGDARWWLCKSAFKIVVERAAKYAASNNSRLRVHVEKTNGDVNKRIMKYFKELRNEGMPFDATRSGKYAPMQCADLKSVLHELRFKDKSSRLMQLADLCLYPLCKRGEYRTYKTFVQHAKLIDSVLPEDTRQTLGIKYFCYDL